MREIKFRGKSTVEVFDGGDTPDINLGDWIYGSLIIDNGEAFIVNGVVECTSEYISIEKWCPVDIKTVGQLTGLKDKNGVEIYEGDVIAYDERDNVAIVEYIAAGFYLNFKQNIRQLVPDIRIEVIGNIYENHELLERS